MNNIIGIGIHNDVSYVTKDSFTPEDDKGWVIIPGVSLYNTELDHLKKNTLYIVTDKVNIDLVDQKKLLSIDYSKESSIYFPTDPAEFERLCSSNIVEILPNEKNRKVQKRLAELCYSDKNRKIWMWGVFEYNPRKKHTQFSIFPHRIDFEDIFENVKKSL